MRLPAGRVLDRARAGGGGSGPRRRSVSLGELRIDRWFKWIVTCYVLVTAATVGYNAHVVYQQRNAGLVINVAARQRGLAEAYMKDTLLKVGGMHANPAGDASLLQANARALLWGGPVVAVQGADATVRIPPAARQWSDWRVMDKLRQEQRLIGRMVSLGGRVLALRPRGAGFPAAVLALRIVGAQVATITNDAVGQMTADAQGASTHLLISVLCLGALWALAAVALGLLLKRAGARQTAQFRSLVHNSSDLVTVVSPGGEILYQSPSAQRLLGVAPSELVGRSLSSIVHPEDAPAVQRTLDVLRLAPDATAGVELRLRHGDGSWREMETMATHADDRAVGGTVLNTRDVTDRKVLEQELMHQAFHDSLTGLANRALLRDRLTRALERGARRGEQVGLLFFDLDGFKTVNDSLGHDAGDELLQVVAERLVAACRKGDAVARLGGDEFAVLLDEDVSEAQAVAISRRILASFREPCLLRSQEVLLSGSIGIALSPGGAGDAGALLRDADTAMYVAKANGRGRFELFSPEMQDRAVEHLEMQGALQRGLVQHEFVLHYQPIFDLATGRLEGAEALLRWRSPERGMVPPAAFLPAAEQGGLMVSLGRWVLREACARAGEWRRRVPGLSVSVNVSPRQLVEADLADQVAEALAWAGLEPSNLVLEITEGSLLRDVEETRRVLGELKGLGVRLAIDDFGTGASSLSHLRAFPVDILKIDKSFVDGLSSSSADGAAFIRTIVSLAETLQLRTVAEGIEDEGQAAALVSLGCGSGQGFLLARPLDAQRMRRLVHAAAGGELLWLPPALQGVERDAAADGR
ncbi:MAG: putative bifunctional diguanylate cyclase/phosphodiesterase [Acidimicrobiales bacterium]